MNRSGLSGISGPTPDFEIWRRHYRFYPFSALLPSAGSAGSSHTLWHPVVELNTGAALALSKFREAAEEFNARNMFNAGGTNDWARPAIVRCMMKVFAALDPQDSNCQAGIELGIAAVHPLPAGAGANLIRLFFDIFNGQWTLKVRSATGQTSATLSGVDAPAIGTPAELGIFFSPGGYVSGAINGKVGATITTNLPTATAMTRGAGYYVGSSSTSTLDQVGAAYVELEAQTIGFP